MAKSRKSPAASSAYDPVAAGFLDARGKLIEVAAFLDRASRRGRQRDFRVQALQSALKKISTHKKATGRAEAALRAFSDLTAAPVRHAGAPAQGAWKK